MIFIPRVNFNEQIAAIVGYQEFDMSANDIIVPNTVNAEFSVILETLSSITCELHLTVVQDFLCVIAKDFSECHVIH